MHTTICSPDVECHHRICREARRASLRSPGELRVVRNRAELRSLGKRASKGRGAARRAQAPQHPLKLTRQQIRARLDLVRTRLDLVRKVRAAQRRILAEHAT